MNYRHGIRGNMKITVLDQVLKSHRESYQSGLNLFVKKTSEQQIEHISYQDQLNLEIIRIQL
jgi:hypothetical protein